MDCPRRIDQEIVITAPSSTDSNSLARGLGPQSAASFLGELGAMPSGGGDPPSLGGSEIPEGQESCFGELLLF